MTVLETVKEVSESDSQIRDQNGTIKSNGEVRSVRGSPNCNVVSVVTDDVDSITSDRECKYLQTDHVVPASLGNFGAVHVTGSTDVHFGTKITVVNAIDEEEADKLGLKDIIARSTELFRTAFSTRINHWTTEQLVIATICVLLLVSAFIIATALIVVDLQKEHFVVPEEIYINESWFITRSGWNAEHPTETKYLKLPVPSVVIGHTADLKYSTLERCIAYTNGIQLDHMLNRRFADIGMNYLICGNGFVMEGRGANLMGAHTYGWNSISIMLMFVGNYNNDELDDGQIKNAQILLDVLQKTGKIKENYALVPADILGGKASPGDNVKKVISGWKHYTKNLTVLENIIAN